MICGSIWCCLLPLLLPNAASYVSCCLPYYITISLQYAFLCFFFFYHIILYYILLTPKRALGLVCSEFGWYIWYFTWCWWYFWLCIWYLGRCILYDTVRTDMKQERIQYEQVGSMLSLLLAAPHSA